MLTWILDRKGCEEQFEKEKPAYKSGLFSTLGTNRAAALVNLSKCWRLF